MPPGPEVAVEDRLFRALAVLRAVLAVHTVFLTAYRWNNFTRPMLAVALIALLVVWTVAMTWAYRAANRRRPPLLLADLAVAVALLLTTPIVKTVNFNASLPGFWVAAALLAWAVQWRVVGGLAAAGVLSAVDLLTRNHIEQNNAANVFLLVLAGLMVGYLTDSLVAMAGERDQALRTAALAQERTRLARAVHDGVLQVLALAQRRGGEPGGDADLGELAAQQESRLRALIQSQDVLAGDRAETDLTVALRRLAGVRISVADHGEPVTMPAERVSEIVAAVNACLDNVRTHVGPEAPAWVLLEATADEVTIAVRDEGPGISEGRLETAAAEGRLGVSESIRGRIADLGGRAELSTGPWGTEWELIVPREAPR